MLCDIVIQHMSNFWELYFTYDDALFNEKQDN